MNDDNPHPETPPAADAPWGVFVSVIFLGKAI